jgi:hypothetical protein
MSNWTAAALLVGTGATTVALASHALPVGTSASSSYSAQSTAAPGVQAPHVNGTVATSGGSGVTVTRTTHMVNVKHAATYHDH